MIRLKLTNPLNMETQKLLNNYVKVSHLGLTSHLISHPNSKELPLRLGQMHAKDSKQRIAMAILDLCFGVNSNR